MAASGWVAAAGSDCKSLMSVAMSFARVVPSLTIVVTSVLSFESEISYLPVAKEYVQDCCRLSVHIPRMHVGLDSLESRKRHCIVC